MTYEDLIVAIDAEAPKLSCVALKLLLRLVSLSIQRGSPEVRASHNWLGEQLGLARESVARASRDLAHIITIQGSIGQVTTFTLPSNWFAQQRSLFAGSEPLKRIHNLPNFQAGSGQDSRQVPANIPGSHLPGKPTALPGFQAPPAQYLGSAANNPGTPCLKSRQPAEQNQQLTGGALIESNRIQILCTGDLVMHIDRCLHTVEIPEDKVADAALLSEQLYQYKCALGPLRELSAYPDSVVLPRIFAIADIEVLHDRLRKLRANGVHCGKQDMWFFTVLMQKIYGASPKLTASRYDCMNTRKPPMTENLPAFGPELVRQVGAGIRRL